MLRRIDRALDSRATVFLACVISCCLSAVFIFIWTPLPWGWKGIDQYYEIAIALARGEPFPTMHLVWGYAYFLAFWYRVFGDHQWIPLVAQALLNATSPVMLYQLVRPTAGQRVAVAAAALAGLFSFNTVYTATQASDSVCTVLVVALMLCLTRGDATRSWRAFAAAGLLAGVAYQFRPNMLLFPPFAAAALLAFRPWERRRLVAIVVFVGTFAIAGLPWVVRNYMWSGLLVPASTHGGVQLWFGTLQAGAYEDSWVYNPRAALEYPPVDYTSIVEMPLIVEGTINACDPSSPGDASLVYWTSRDRTPRRVGARPDAANHVRFDVPRQPASTALYYYFENRATVAGEVRATRTPSDGDRVPYRLVVSQNHLGDLDVDQMSVDVFDVARLARHVEWHDQPVDPRLDLDGDGHIDQADLRRAVAVLAHDRDSLETARDEVTQIRAGTADISLAFTDGSSLSVPRNWNGSLGDLPLKTVGVGSIAAQIVGRSRTFAELERHAPEPVARCPSVTEVGANRVPYRRLPHEMRRFTALAWDNIRHDPLAYLIASAHRAFRVFVIEGSDDTRTAYQFRQAGLIYRLGRIASLGFFGLFLVGLAIAIARGLPVLMLILPVVYVPATICFMLINARYSMTSQPFVFAFVAIALVTGWDAIGARRPAAPVPAPPAAER